MKMSRRKLAAIIGVALVVVMGISAFSSTVTFTRCRITMYADPATDISLGQFQECACVNPFTSYDWDGIVEGEYYQCPVYVKNTGTVGLYVTYLPTDVWLSEDPPGSGVYQTHFVITCWVMEFGMPCELYKLSPPVQLPEKDPTNCKLGFYLPPGKVIKVDIVLFVDSIVLKETYSWDFTFWGCYQVERKPLPAKLALDKFNDTNGNGVYDAGDVKISGWRIDVMDPHGLTTTHFTPTALEITEFGAYTVTEDRPFDWVQTAVQVDGVYKDPPTAGVIVNINEGETHSVLYGNKVAPRPAGLVIEKFNDTNANGVYDIGIDVMISGWKINVTDPDGVTRTLFTPIGLIGILKFGTYIVTEDLPAGWEQTALRVNGVYVVPTVTYHLLINEGETHEVLYGNRVLPRLAKLILDKFNDVNGNGVYDTGDVKITDWRIDVRDPHGGITTYLTPKVVEITEFGTYTITEDLRVGWEQTAVRVDGTYISPPTGTVTVVINEGETHEVLYGNRVPPPPRIRIGLGINPLGDIPVSTNVIFRWGIVEDPPGKTVPQKVTLTLTKVGGTSKILYVGSTFPKDFTGEVTWHADEAGNYEIKVRYDYLYLGKPYYAAATHVFTVVP